jgi:L-threonylcarbamoyladenylate synthase
MRTELLSTHTPALFQAAVERAAERLRAGEVVVLPTETVYGLAANALDPAAVGRVFDLKGRPLHNPLIVHVVGVEMARRCAADWPATADALARAFWPGPLTIVLPKAEEIPAMVTAGGDTVGLRWPSHPFIQAVIVRCGFPLAAPSANLSNQLSPTQAQHVLKTLDGRVGLVVDGGQCQVGIESTVVDLAAAPPRILRPGLVHGPALEAVLGFSLGAGGSGPGPVRSPGQMPRHYAPRAKLLIWTGETEEDLARRVRALGFEPGAVRVVAHTRIPNEAGWGGVSVIPHDPEAFARALYAELHRCDDEGAPLVIVEAVPAGPEWEGVADRLLRASR